MAFASSLIGGARKAANKHLSPFSQKTMLDNMNLDEVNARFSQPDPVPSSGTLIGGGRKLPPPPTLPTKQPSLWDGIVQDPLAFFLTGSNGVRSRQEADAKRAAANAQQEYMAQLAQDSGMDAGAWFAYNAAPQEFGKSWATNYEAANVEGGSSRVFGNGRQTYNAPEYGVDGGFGYSAGPTGIDWFDQRGMSHEETNTGFNNDTQRMQADETARNNRARTAVDWATVGVNRDKNDLEREQFELRKQGGAGFWDPTQLASIYKDNMEAVDKVKEEQARLDAIDANASQFVDLVNRTGYNAESGGPIADIAQFLSLDTGTLNQNTAAIAPLMRQPGSGGNSDNDIQMFKQGGVSINNPHDANARFAAGSKALAQRNRDYVAYLQKNISATDPTSRQRAELLWSEYKDAEPLFTPDGKPRASVKSFENWYAAKYGAAPAGPAGPAGPPSAGATRGGPPTRNQNIVRITDAGPAGKAQMDALPPGTQFVAPDGTMWTKK